MDLSQTASRQADAFVRSVGRSAEATASLLVRLEECLRRETPDTVARCQSLLDEHLPPTLAAARTGDLGSRAEASLRAMDDSLCEHSAALQAVAEKLGAKLEDESARLTEEQRLQHERELADAKLSASQPDPA